MNKVKTVLSEICSHTEVNKSKFIAYLFPCMSVDAFDINLVRIKKEHSGASHHCFAYRIYESLLIERYQDDKEPAKTAGLPILEVLKGNDLYQCGGVVVRYFGGTKLGTGGLSRAYSDAMRDALKEAQIVIAEEAVYLRVSVDYGSTGKIEYYFASNSIPVVKTVYASDVCYTIVVPEEKQVHRESELTEMTAGQSVVSIEGKCMGYFTSSQFILL